jgi:hypothetical protein
MLFQAVIGACLESPEDLCVCPLHLAVAPWVSHGRKAELGADVLAILLEDSTCKMVPLFVMIRLGTPNLQTIDLRKATAAPWVMLTTGVAPGHFVNLSMATKRNQYLPMALGNGPGISTPPNGEWPGGWNHLQSLSSCVYLLCVELARLAGLYHLNCILESGWPVKAMPEGLTDQRAG